MRKINKARSALVLIALSATACVWHDKFALLAMFIGFIIGVLAHAVRIVFLRPRPDSDSPPHIDSTFFVKYEPITRQKTTYFLSLDRAETWHQNNVSFEINEHFKSAFKAYLLMYKARDGKFINPRILDHLSFSPISCIAHDFMDALANSLNAHGGGYTYNKNDLNKFLKSDFKKKWR